MGGGVAKRENDKTRDIARPMIVISAIRAGGTFLAHCLSNHSQIYCDRGEPFHHRSVWVQSMNPDRLQLLAVMLNQTGYRVSGCKLTYTQALHRNVWPWIVDRQPLVIWLRRQNKIRQAVSVLLNKRSRDGQFKRPQHTFEEPSPLQVELPSAAILTTARGLESRDRRAGKMLSRIDRVLSLTYAQIVGGEQGAPEWLDAQATTRVCEFLGVRRELMRCDLQRVNRYPLRAILTNWPEVRRAVKGSEFAACLSDEEAWADG